MAFGCEVYDAVDVLCLHEPEYAVEVADVHLDELVIGLVLYVLEVGEVACVGEFVEVDDVVFRILVDEQADYVAADEAGAAGDDDILHCAYRSVLMSNGVLNLSNVACLVSLSDRMAFSTGICQSMPSVVSKMDMPSSDSGW